MADKNNSVSAYVYVMNNPLLFTDPFGLDTLKQDFQYSNGYQMLSSRNSSTSNEYSGVYQNTHTLRQATPSTGDKWKNGNLAQRVAYDIADGVYSIAGDKHLNGDGFDSYEDKIKTKLGGLLTIGGTVFAEMNALVKAGTGERVFWSGGNVAKNAAMDFAKSNGMKTLEMTTGGRIMNSVGPYLPRSVSSPIWDSLSRNFARGTSGNVNVFQNAAGVSLKSTWKRIEYPILQNNNIFYHIVK